MRSVASSLLLVPLSSIYSPMGKGSGLRPYRFLQHEPITLLGQGRA
jgi:hypothetical protein